MTDSTNFGSFWEQIANNDVKTDNIISELIESNKILTEMIENLSVSQNYFITLIVSLTGIAIAAIIAYLLNLRRDRTKVKRELAIKMLQDFDNFSVHYENALRILTDPSQVSFAVGKEYTGKKGAKTIDGKVTRYNHIARVANWFNLLMMYFHKEYLEKEIISNSGIIEVAVHFTAVVEEKAKQAHVLNSLLEGAPYLKQAYIEEKKKRIAKERAKLEVR